MNFIPKNKIVCSFSGGRTSARMTHEVRKRYGNTHEVISIFSNTGLEDERTLRFVDRCDRGLGFNSVGVEAVIHQEHGVGTTHRVVDFASAHRGGDIFEDMIKKYG